MKSDLQSALGDVVRLLESKGVDYCLVGGLRASRQGSI